MLQSMMQQEISIKRVTGRDEYNHPAHEVVGPYLCLLDGKNTLVRTMTGEEVVSGTTAYLAQFVPGISEGDTALVPAYDVNGDLLAEPAEETIISAATHYDQTGPMFTVLYLR